MPVNKRHDEFHTLDMSAGWETPEGYPTGIEQKILAGSLDERARRGTRTRLLRFQPGVFTTAPFVHDYWEEVYLVSGDLTVGNDAAGRLQAGYVPAEVAPEVRGDEQALSLWEFRGEDGARIGLRVLLAPADAWIQEPRA